MNKSSHNFYTISDEIKDELLTGLFKEIDKRNSYNNSWLKWRNLHGPFKVFLYNVSYCQTKNELQFPNEYENPTNMHELFDCIQFFPIISKGAVKIHSDTSASLLTLDQIIYTSDQCVLHIEYHISRWFKNSLSDSSGGEDYRYINLDARFVHQDKLELKYVLSTLPKELVKKYLKKSESR